MDEIKELIKIVTDNTKKNVPLLDLKNQHQNGNKEMNLFLGIKNGDFSSDEEASHGIYGSEEVDFKFRMLKSRLNRKLLNHLFFMDFTSSKYTKSTSYYQEVLDYFHFARMLLNIGEVKLGSKILQKAIDLAREGEFTSIQKDCLRELRKVYAKTYRPKLFQNIKDQINTVEALESLEEDADEIFQENRLYINSSVTNRKKDFKPYQEAITQLKKLYKETNSYNIFEKYFMLKIWYHELAGEFDEVLGFVSEIEKDESKGKLNQKRLDHLFINTAKGNALIKLKKFDEGIDFLEKMLREIDSASSDWYFFAERYVMLHIQNEQFDKASEVYLRVVGNKSFRELSDRQVLQWSIICSYLYFFTRNRRLIKKFDYKQFINNTPDFVKENAGYHVSILILQILEGIDGELEKLYSKLDALDDYVSRYLNNSFSKRTKTFCKLLHKIAIHNRDHETIVAKSRYLQEKLHDSEIVGESFVDFEIVPYEFLWVRALEKAKNYK
jgi:tetratricopeptide (TPR) repeat protein